MNTIRSAKPRRLSKASFIALLAIAGSLGPATAAEQSSTTSISQCPSGYMCVWTGTSYSGTMQKFIGSGSYRSINFARINSAYNRRADRTFIHEESDGSGVYACYSPGERNANLSGWVEYAEAVYLSTATNC
jgi:hypothetical protein